MWNEGLISGGPLHRCTHVFNGPKHKTATVEFPGHDFLWCMYGNPLCHHCASWCVEPSGRLLTTFGICLRVLQDSNMRYWKSTSSATLYHIQRLPYIDDTCFQYCALTHISLTVLMLVRCPKEAVKLNHSLTLLMLEMDYSSFGG